MRLLIILRGLYLATHGTTVGEFKHVAKYDAHILNGEALTPAQFNAVMQSPEWERLIERHGARIRVKCVNHNDMRKARAAAGLATP
ncbi:MAG TPA: hypothetical protein VD994_09125 [Prosthecobacter sp.]|nr:hypothetical protein [Prosthecobacter sp.]